MSNNIIKYCYLPLAVLIALMLVGPSKYLKQEFKLHLTGLRALTGQRQTSWLFKSVAEDLNLGPLWTNPASGQSRTWTQDLQIASPAL